MRYQLYYYQPHYGSVTIEADDEDEAKEIFWNDSLYENNWDNSGDIEIEEVKRMATKAGNIPV